MSKIEYRDLYDINRNLTGACFQKGQNVPIGKYFLVVLVFIENDDGMMLLQRRSPAKGGLWAMTGGHPKSGESSLEGMMTEIKEEIGIEVAANELKLFKTIIDDVSILDLYFLKKNIDLKSVVLQEEEVTDVKWFSKKEIENLISNGEFFKHNIIEYNYFLDYKK